MADVRINALATTATTSASDDYLAIDGSANGTRKLSAYSPTFGGNLTVSGTGGITATGGNIISGPNWFQSSNNAGLLSNLYFNSGWKYVGNGAGAAIYADSSNGAIFATAAVNSSGAGAAATLTTALTLSGANATLAGNLTVNGTGTSSFAGKIQTTSANGIEAIVASGNTGLSLQTGTTQYSLYVNAADNSYRLYSSLGGDRFAVSSSGNFLLKSDGVDSANGKLQLATHTTSAGGIGFGTDLSLYRANTGFLILNDASAALDARIGLYNNGTQRGLFEAYNVGTAVYIGAASASWSTIITSGNQATALTLDSSQNATFAGKITTNGISGINALAAGTQLATFESSVNGAAVELITKGKNSTGTARAAYIGLNRFADDVLSISDGTTERLRLGLTNGNLTVTGALKLGNAYTAGAPTATGYVTIQDSAGNTYKVLVGT